MTDQSPGGPGRGADDATGAMASPADPRAMPGGDYHPPPEKRGVSWFELFFDLVLVAWLMSANSIFSEAETSAQAVQGVLSVMVAYVIWTLTTTTINRFPGDTTLRRSLMVTQMLFLLISILAIDPYHGLPNRLGVVAIGVVFLSIAGMYLEVAVSKKYGGGPTWIAVFGVLAAALVCFVLAPIVTDDSTALFIAIPVVASVVAIVPIVLFYSPRIEALHPIDVEHLTERWGQLTLITLGEGFIFMVEVFWGRTSIPRPLTFFIVFLTLFALWRLIFDSATLTPGPKESFPFGALIVAHLLLLLGIVGYINAVIEEGLAGEGERFAFLQVGISLGLVLASLAWINVERRVGFERISAVELVLAMLFVIYGAALYVWPSQPIASFVSTCSLAIILVAVFLNKLDPRFPGTRFRL